MCGILGVISNNKNTIKIINEGIRQLQNRGYDSFGVSYFKQNNIKTIKQASIEKRDSITFVMKQIQNETIYNIISHTRWATHGPKNNVNSHPHNSINNKFSLVHNGIIENYLELKQFLSDNNVRCISDTDSEIIVNLISYYYNLTNNIQDSIHKTTLLLKGSWALLILCDDNTENIYAICNGSPLLLGFNNNLVIFSSEVSGFNNYINKYIVIKENELIIVKKDINRVVINNLDTYTIKKKLNIIDSFDIPKPYTFWLEKEINDQYLYTKQLKNLLLNKIHSILKNHTNELKLINNIVLLGCRTSYHAAMMGKHYLKKIDLFYNVQSINASNFDINDIPKIGSTAVIVLSQSGETKDLLGCLDILPRNIYTIAIINSAESTIARKCDLILNLDVGREISVASTKSFTAQIIFLQIITTYYKYIYSNNNKLWSIQTLDLDIKNTLDIASSEINKYVSSLISPSMFILGKGKYFTIARESALKIKEITYIHAEGYSGSALKHGPYSLIKENFPVILFIMNDEHMSMMMNCYNQVISRKAFTLVITNISHLDVINKIVIPSNQSEIHSTIILQYVSYLIGNKLKLAIDRPRNLAKCVTTH